MHDEYFDKLVVKRIIVIALELSRLKQVLL